MQGNKVMKHANENKRDGTSGAKHAIVVLLGAAGIALSMSAQAGPITVPNGDFSVAGNIGSVGGGLIGSAGTDIGIGPSAGPWTATYNGVLSLLAPPTLTINSGSATISGVLGVNVIAPLSNGAFFSQTLPVSYQPNKRYTMSADIDAGGSLGLGVLATTNVGIGLRSGSTVIGSSATAPAALVSLAPLAATSYHLTFVHDTGPTVSGNVNVMLFDQPQNLVTAQLLTSISFANVALNVGAITTPDSQLYVSGLGSQGAEVGTPFGAPLMAKVTDQNNLPLEGVIVTVTAPPTGASAILVSGSNSGSSIEAVTDSDGQITVSAHANAIAGCYAVTASIDGVTSTALFHLRNWSPAQAMYLYQSGPAFPFELQDSIFCDGYE